MAVRNNLRARSLMSEAELEDSGGENALRRTVKRPAAPAASQSKLVQQLLANWQGLGTEVGIGSAGTASAEIGGRPLQQVAEDFAKRLEEKGITDLSQASFTPGEMAAWTAEGRGNVSLVATQDGRLVPVWGSSSDASKARNIALSVGAMFVAPGLASALGGGLAGSMGAGAILGGGRAALTGGDILKGALTGGALGGVGYGVTNALAPSGGIGGASSAEFADMAAGLTPEFGTTAAYNAAIAPATTAAAAAPATIAANALAPAAQLTPAAIEAGLGTAGYGYNAAAAASNLFSPAAIGAGAALPFEAMVPSVAAAAPAAAAPAAAVEAAAPAAAVEAAAPQLTPAAIESGLGTPGYGYNAAAASSGLFDPALIGAGAASVPIAASIAPAATGATQAATMATNPFQFLVPAAASLIGGAMTSRAAEKAAETSGEASVRAAELQREAQREALALQERMYREGVERQKPYYEAGVAALPELQRRAAATSLGFQYGGEQPAAFSYGGQPTAFSYSGELPAAFQYGGALPTFNYAGGPATFQYSAAQPTFNYAGGPATFQYAGQQPGEFQYSGQLPEAFKFTPDQLQTDPGYAFRLKEGLKAIESSAAARGGLLSGGTGKALTRYGQEVASQEYQNAFGRALTGYNALMAREQQQYGRALTGYEMGRAREQEQYGRALTGYGLGRAAEQEQYGRALTGYERARAAEQEQYGRALTGYGLGRAAEQEQYGRAAQGYERARAAEQEQYGRALTGYNALLAREQQQYGRALTGFEAARAQEAEQFRRAALGYESARTREQEQYGRALTAYNAARAREAEDYSRLAGLAGFGSSTAQQIGAAGQQYAGAGASLLTGAAANIGNLLAGQGQTAANALLTGAAGYQRSLGDLASLYARMYGPQQPTYILPSPGGP